MKIVIFDMDGVLFDSILIAETYVQTVYPGLTPQMQKELLVGNFFEELQKYRSTLPPKTETPEEKEIRQAAYAQAKLGVSMYDGVRDFLGRLHTKGYTLVLNTSALERNCVPLLEKEGIKEMFDFIATGEVSKSKVEKFRMIEDKFKVSAPELIFVTDTLGDIREADIANVPTIAVTWGAHDHSFFNREPHQNLKKIVDTVFELEEYIYTNLSL